MITANQRQDAIEIYLKNIELSLNAVRVHLSAMKKGRGSPKIVVGLINQIGFSAAHAKEFAQELLDMPRATVKPTLDDDRFQAAGQDATLQKLIKRVSQQTPIRAGAKRKTGGAK